MRSLHVMLAAVLTLIGASAAWGNQPALFTSQGVIEKADKTTLTLKTRAADGAPGRTMTFQLTSTTWVTEVLLEKRGPRSIPVQRDLELKDLEVGQSIAVIYTATSGGAVVLSAVVTEPQGKQTEKPKEPKDAPAGLPKGVPDKVAKVLAHLDAEDEAIEGYVGGRRFFNLGREGEQELPRRDRQGRPISYREWDVNPLVPGRNRGAERLVTGTDGSAWYTADHYKTYIRIR